MSHHKFYGKYRGTVANNIDPMQIGRVQVIVPDVSDLVPSGWAMPCFPIAGKQVGAYLLPAIGSAVWVEYERGDPDFPIWTGCFYASVAEVPSLALIDNPSSGDIVVKSSSGATIVVNDTGIYIENGKGASLVLTGPSVDINNGALVVV
jgi:uncharacterized protein involved in type VI secretion and phage assembly